MLEKIDYSKVSRVSANRKIGGRYFVGTKEGDGLKAIERCVRRKICFAMLADDSMIIPFNSEF